MSFRTKLDYSDNRQIKQRPNTLTHLSGGTTFGLPINELPTGPDLSTSAITETIYDAGSLFLTSGGVTTYAWYEDIMQIGYPYLSAITPSNSGTTQYVPEIFTAGTTTIIDGRTVVLNYSGLSYDLTAIAMFDLGGGNYSGTVVSNKVEFYSAATLEYTGRTIWVDVLGITRTQQLIVTNGAQSGYVLTCINSEGVGEWRPSTGGAIVPVTSYWTAGTGANSVITIGSNNIASGDYSLAEGHETIANGWSSHVEGQFTIASGQASHAEGQYTTAGGNFSHTEGIGTITIGEAAHAEGNYTTSIGDSAHAEGSGTIASGWTSHAEGNLTTAGGDFSHAEGQSTIAYGSSSHAEGYFSKANGQYSHAEGYSTEATGTTAHAEGYETKAYGDWSHAEGHQTQALSYAAHAEGDGSIAHDRLSHAEGDHTHAYNGSHSEGSYTQALGTNCHTEGDSTIADFTSSHAEGSGSIATGQTSHAEGFATMASGDYSHAQGANTIANGMTSHAGGSSSTAIGNFSFVHGENSIANGNATIVLGSNLNGALDNTTYVENLNIKIGGSLLLGNTLINEPTLAITSASLSTGLYLFNNNGITTTGATTFNVGAVKGWIVDSDDVLNANPSFVDYAGGSGLTTPYRLTDPASYLMIDKNSQLVITNIRPTSTQRRDNIYLGAVGHAGTLIDSYGNQPDIIMNEMSQVRAMFEPLRLINEGVIAYPNGITLALANTAGVLYGLGIGFIKNGNDSPTSVSVPAGTPTVFQYRTRNSGAFGDTSLIDPLQWDNNGNLETVPGNAQSTNATNQRIYLLEDASIRVQYGQTVYATIAAAVSAANNEAFVVFSNNKNLGILIGILSVGKNATNLRDTTYAQFLPVSKFGESVGAAAGISTTTLQSAYNNSGNPEIITNTINGDVTIKRGSSLDTDLIFSTQNGAGTTRFSIDGNGLTTVQTLKIGFVNTGTLVNNLGIDTNGNVIIGSTGGGGTSYWSASTGLNSIVTINSGNRARGAYALAEGTGTTAHGDASHSEGYLTYAGPQSADTGSTVFIIGGNDSYSSHAEGYGTKAYGIASHAEGQQTIASGFSSHAEGQGATAFGSYAHAEGINTIASGQSSHAEGQETQANGLFSHTEGSFTIAMRDGCHAEGVSTTAKGQYSHAEGYSTTAGNDADVFGYGMGCHAEGYETQATGDFGSHSEGWATRAIGQASHAEGYETTASTWAHSGGFSTRANGTASFVHGQYSMANGSNTIVLGANITGATADTTYVDRLNIKTLGAGASTADIGRDAGGNVVTVSSDETLKENITTLENSLDKVKLLRGVKYQWKDREAGGDNFRLGFIAQEVNAVEPLLVTDIGNGLLGVQYREVIPLLVEATKELSSEMNAIIKDGELIIPNYTPSSTTDINGFIGSLSRDDNYLYVKTTTGWKRTNLENF